MKHFPILLFISLILLISCQSESSEQTKTTTTAPTEINDPPLSNTPNEKQVNHVPLPEWPIQAAKEKGKELPCDEAPKDQSFFEFRQKLYNHIKAKDTDFLHHVLSDSVFCSFGGETGKELFFKMWQLDTAPDRSDLWKEMATCLELGGKFNNYDGRTRFAAPYIYMLEVFDDPYQEGIIVGEKVRLRDAPGLKSKVIGSLSWDYYIRSNVENYEEEEIDGEKHAWIKLKTLNGESGYVFGKYARSIIDYRVGFVKENEKDWKIDFFVAGD